MFSNVKQELIIKLIGKLTLEFPEINQLRVREIAEETLYKYDIAPQETALITSDIEEKIQYYIAVKRLEGLSEKTLKNYYLNLMVFADYIHKPISCVDIMDIRRYLAVRCQHLKPSTVNGQISYLKSFFAFLHDEDYIPKNVMTKIKQTKQPQRLRHALSDEEVEHLRQACKTLREKALIEFLVSTGARLSEVTQINISSINWHERSLCVIGKGNKERRIYFSVKAKVLLEKYISTRAGNSEALFIGERSPYARLGNRGVEKIIQKIAKSANFDKAVFPHIFRHSFATHNLNAGMPLPVLQELMGHTTGDTTMKYAKLNEENVRHEYRKVG